MNIESSNASRARASWCAIAMGLCLFVYHLAINRQYGFHGDELYFMVCGTRPAWGYVDHPPFVPMLARLATAVMGTNLFALRVCLALSLGVSCALTGWLARRLGAGLFGEFLAALSFVCAPLMLRIGAFLNIPCFEVFFWLVAVHLIVTVIKNDQPRWWVAIGVVAGVSLLNKHTTLFLGTGIAVGLLLTQRRKDLATPWPWVGGVLAFLIFLPNLVWQYQHDWATLEFVRNINASIMQQTPRAEFILAQLILMNVVNVALWLAGLYFFFVYTSGRPYRIIGCVFVTVVVIMLALKAKVYYLVPAYPMLMAGGAVVLEQKLTGSMGYVVRAGLAVALAAVGLVFVPIMSPIGTIEWKEQYISSVLGFMLDDPSDLTFDFRNQRFRLEELQTFLSVYKGLSDDEKKDCAILTYEYDGASSVNIVGRAMGLPQGISGNNSYYLWGPRNATGKCIIAIGYDEQFLKANFRQVSVAAEAPNRSRKDANVGRKVYLCRDSTAPLDEIWPRFKTFH